MRSQGGFNIQFTNIHTSVKKSIVNIIRLTMLSLAMVWLVNVTAYAQSNKKLTAEQRTEKAVKLMTQNLGLNVGQIAKVEEANLAFQYARDAAKTNQDQTALREARKAYRNELKKILTQDQYKKFKQTHRS